MKKSLLTLVLGLLYLPLSAMEKESPYYVSWVNLHSQVPAQIAKNYVCLSNRSQGTLVSERDIEIFYLKKNHSTDLKKIDITYCLAPGLIYHKLQDQFLQVPACAQKNNIKLLEHSVYCLIGLNNRVGAMPALAIDKTGFNKAIYYSPGVYKNEWSQPYFVFSGYAKTALFAGISFIAYRELKSLSGEYLSGST